MQGIPRAHFEVVKDDPQSFETGGLALPRCLTEEQKPLPCLTTPSDDPQGRPAPRSSKGKISSEANQRWCADRQRFAPWHYEAGVMMTDSQGRFVLPPPSVKEQWHHLPRNWTEQLPEHDRHKALANGGHAGAARLMMAMFAATPPASARELNPIGGTALDIAANLWQGRPPLLGPGPGDYDEFDLSHLEDPSEHWFRSRSMPHPDHRDAQMEPGLQQWLNMQISASKLFNRSSSSRSTWRMKPEPGTRPSLRTSGRPTPASLECAHCNYPYCGRSARSSDGKTGASSRSLLEVLDYWAR